MTKYFENCKTEDELKKAYRKMAAKLHPDNNPARDTTKEFQEMQEEFQEAFERLKGVHVNMGGETYRKESSETAGEFMDLINKLLQLGNIDVELCGSWIWVSGNTKPVKEELKALGFKWSSKKKTWYFHKEPYVKRGKKQYSMNDIRNMWGSTSYSRNSNADPEFITA